MSKGLVAGALPFFVAAFSFAAHSSSGTATGCVTYNDDRLECCTGISGCRATVCNSSVGSSSTPLRKAQVKLLATVGGIPSIIGSADANSSGCYSISWSDPDGSAGTETLLVYLRDSNDFEVVTTSDSVISFGSTVNVSSGTQALGTLNLGGSESIQNYAEAEDYFTNVVDADSTLSSRMTDVHIVNNASATNTQNRNEVWVQDGFEESRNITALSHELGHASAMHAMSEDIYYLCWPDHRYREAASCEQVAWFEGLANFFAATRAWTNTAVLDTTSTTPVNCSGDSPCPNFFSLGRLETITPAYCLGPDNWMVEACQTGALWDAFDNPASDDDAITSLSPTVNINTIVGVLKNYSHGCWPITDRCSNEGSGMNHWDFLFNWDDFVANSTLSSEMRDVYVQHLLDEGGSSPWP